MRRSRQTIAESLPRIFSPKQAEAILDVLDSASVSEEAQSARPRNVIVGGQVVLGGSADERNTTTDGGQTTVPNDPSESPLKGDKGDKGDQGEPGEPGEPGADGSDGQNGALDQAQVDAIQLDIDSRLLRSGDSYVTFSTTPTGVPVAVGTISWNASEDTFDIQMSNGVTLQVGQELQTYVVNKSGATILNGSVVYLVGSQSGHPSVELADADTASTAKAYGVTTMDIPNNAHGKITVAGLVRGLATHAFTEGAEVWLSSTPGQVVSTPPAFPASQVSIGIISRSHPTDGWLCVAIKGDYAMRIHTHDHNSTTNLNTGDYQHLAAVQKTDLTDGGDSSLHFHSADRARSGHTGTQLASTISDFASAADSRIAAQKGVANGLATLDGNTKIPLSQIPDALVGQVKFQALWNQTTNTPALPATPATGSKGYYWICTDVAQATFQGLALNTGDWLIVNGNEGALSWGKVDNTDSVTSVFGRTGPIAAQAGDYSAFYQPLDSDLTAIAALATTAYGRGFLPLADAAAALSYIGAQPAGSYQPLDADLTAIAALSTQAFGRSLLTAVDAAAGRALLGAGSPGINGKAEMGTWFGNADTAWFGYVGTNVSLPAYGITVTPSQINMFASSAIIFNGGIGDYILTLTPNGVYGVTAHRKINAMNGIVSGAEISGTNAVFSATISEGGQLLSAKYQALDADLTAIAALATTGFARRTGANTWAASAIAWSDISGIISYGSAAGTVCQGNDSRLSDARTPLAHTQAWSTITSIPFKFQDHPGDSAYEGFWPSGVTSGTANFAILWKKDSDETYVSAGTRLNFQTVGTGGTRENRMVITDTAITASVPVSGTTATFTGMTIGSAAILLNGAGVGGRYLSDGDGGIYLAVNGAANAGKVIYLETYDTDVFHRKNGTDYKLWDAGNFTGTQNGHNHAGVYQPLDSDLTAIAALPTQTFGLSLLTAVDAAAGRTLLGAQIAGSYESALGNPGTSGWLLSSTTAGVRSWVAPYSHPATHLQSVVDSASGWITTALAGKQAAGSYQPLDADLTAISSLATTGFVRRTATNTWSASAIAWGDISGVISYGTAAGTVCQGNDSRLSNSRTPTAHVLDSASHTISGKTAGQILLATAATTYAFTTLSGDATLAGTGALTLANTITAGSAGSGASVPVITWDAKGRLTAVSAASITPAGIGAQVAGSYENSLGLPATNGYLLSSTTAGVRSWVAPYSHPATHPQSVVDSASGWITTALAGKQAAGSYQPLDADLTAISALATTGFVRRTATNTWSASAMAWSDISGIISYGSTAGTVCQGNDSRVINGQTAYGWGNHASAGYLTTASAASTYQTIAGMTSYSTKVVADTLYQQKEDQRLSTGYGPTFTSVTAGYAMISSWGQSPFAEFSNISQAGGDGYGILHGGDGELYLNAATTKSVHIRNNNAGYQTYSDLAVFGQSLASINSPAEFNNNTTFKASLIANGDIDVSSAGRLIINNRVQVANGAELPVVVAGQIALIYGSIGSMSKPITNSSQICNYRNAAGDFASASNGGFSVDCDLNGRSAILIGVSSARVTLIV